MNKMFNTTEKDFPRKKPEPDNLALTQAANNARKTHAAPVWEGYAENDAQPALSVE